MKRKYIFIAVIIPLVTISAFAQDKSAVFNVNPQFSFFFAKNKHLDKSFNPIYPGLEILYEKEFSELLSISTGINYDYSSWNSSVGIKSHFKRLSHEVFLPVIFNADLSKNFYTSFGIYPGWLVSGKELYRNNIDIKNWIDNTANTNYSSSPKFSADLYFGAGFNHVINEKRTIRFIPFLKYKLKDNWMGEVRERISAGVKINFMFDFKY